MLKKFGQDYVYINGASFCPAVYINCSYDIAKKERVKDKENCTFFQKAELNDEADFGDSDIICVLAKRQIKIGEEVIVDYGDSFPYENMRTSVLKLRDTVAKSKIHIQEVEDVDEMLFNLSQRDSDVIDFSQPIPSQISGVNWESQVDKSIDEEQHSMDQNQYLEVPELITDTDENEESKIFDANANFN